VKKHILFFTVFALLTGSIYAQQLNLDAVIERSARAVEESLPEGTKVAVLNFVSASEIFSDHVIDELTGKLVNGRKITIVDRRNLALITNEMNLQLSGDVSDESAQAIGRMLGAQSIISGNLTNMGTFYRFRIRVINVETVAIQTQASYDLRNDEQVAFLLGGSQTSIPPAVSGRTTSNTAVQQQSSADVVTPLTEGTIVPGNNLTAKLTWLQRNAESHNTYILIVNANETIVPHTFDFANAINITIAIRGDNQNRIIRLQSHGAMFTVRANITFILENNITFHGHNENNRAIIILDGGTVRMRTGATITNNINTNTNDNFIGGGVRINRGNFEMTGGTISGNRRGGVRIVNGTFTLNGGTISGNSGAGVAVLSRTTFTMTGGVISGNRATNGGGVWVNGTFNMRGGTITGNTAAERGGGVFIASYSNFNKTGGTITGFNSDQNNGNAVRDESGELARRGHAVAFGTNVDPRKETTAGPTANLSVSGSGSSRSGAWDQ
jgi:TolB-like protein